MTPLNFEDTSSIDTFPLATFHTDSLQPDTTTTPDWQRLNTIINQRSTELATTRTLLSPKNSSSYQLPLDSRTTRASPNSNQLSLGSSVPNHLCAYSNRYRPLDDISMSSLDTLVSTTMMTDDHSLQDTFSISTISDFSFEEHNNPGFTHTTPPHDNAMGTTDIVTTPIHPEPTNLSLTDEVHRIVTGTSQKFVPPTLSLGMTNSDVVKQLSKHHGPVSMPTRPIRQT
ncbi:hypothetical protein SEMRO_188_G081350.1 [Seminavis robusta]|uniref:Uncharacterized protein n=1 Tax=Seminavis robusta TaxID=568900 RepID=A0A9N8DK63_9STRA|nr:hypothetical protein SEMRO_188_G081350.1 [Seminavis robusta]|eukprot:Sro188_g081350.1 n/a (228) ;mRNA; f:94526-95209